MEFIAKPEEATSKEVLARAIVNAYKRQYREELIGEVEVPL